MEDAVIEIAVNNLLHIGPEKPILLGKTLIIDLPKFGIQGIPGGLQDFGKVFHDKKG